MGRAVNSPAASATANLPISADDCGITLIGAGMAALSGAVLGGGWSMLHDEEYTLAKTRRKAFGGSMFVFGLYLFAPTMLRKAWLSSNMS
jgi:hypothetical protein